MALVLLASCGALDDVEATNADRRPVCEVRASAAPVVVATVPSGLGELSGLVASPSGESVLFAHNDSGDAPRLFAMLRDGSLAATIELDVALVDAEGVGAGHCPDGIGLCLVIGDVGDNTRTRTDAHLVFVREPRIDAARRDEVLRGEVVADVPIAYPAGSVDVEGVALTFDGTRAFLVEKTDDLEARVFVVDAPFVDGVTASARVLTTIRSPGLAVPLGRMITSLDVHPTSRALLLRTYTGVFESVVDAPADDDEAWRALFTAPWRVIAVGPLREPQGEAVAYDIDGTTVLSASEVLVGQGGQPLLAIPCADP